MSNHDAFLREITANPEDLTPRLIYADWLDEQGDPRGEFIRVQCELAAIDETEDRYGDLLVRERELLAEHRQEWLKPLKPYVREGTFRCGFIERVNIRLDKLLSNGEEIARRTPVRTVAVTSTFEAPQLMQIRKSPILKQLNGLEFHGFQEIVQLFPTLAQLPKLKRVTISGKWPLNGKNIRRLLCPEMCRHLKSLDLPDNRIASYCLKEITQSEACLKNLDLSNNREIGAGIDHLAKWSQLSELESLNLNRCNLNTSVVRPLLESPGLGRLKHLGVNNSNYNYHEGLLGMISRSHAMSQLTALDLAGHPSDADDVIALTNSPYLNNLRRLDLSLQRDHDASLILLSQWEGLRAIRHLRLTRLPGFHVFLEDDLKRIIHSPHWNANSVLSITPHNAQFIGLVGENKSRWEGYNIDLGEVPMGYLHDPIGLI